MSKTAQVVLTDLNEEYVQNKHLREYRPSVSNTINAIIAEHRELTQGK